MSGFTGDLSELPGWDLAPTDNPARSGFDQGDVDTGSFDTSSGGGWFDRNITPGLSKLPDALKSLNDGQKKAEDQAKDTAMKLNALQAAAMHQSQGGSLNELVGLLLQRQNALYGSATGGQGAGQPQPASRMSGLLGF